MTVRELMEMLSQFSPDLEVRFEDTYEQSEGWTDGCENATCAIGNVYFDVAECAIILQEVF